MLMNFTYLKKILQTFIFFIVVTYIYRNINFSELKNLFEFHENSIFIIVLFLLITFLTNTFQTIRWKILIEYFKEKSNFYLYFKFITYSNLLSEISFLGLFSRIMINLYSKIKTVNIVLSVFIEKVFSFYSLLLLCSFSLFLLIEGNIFELNIISKEYFLFFILSLILFPIFLIKIKKLKVFNFFKKIKFTKKLFYFLNYKFFFLIILNSLIIQILAVISICLLSKLFNFNIDLLTLFLIVPVLNFFISLPASISPWGWREFIFINILPFIGFSNEQSALLSITNGIFLLISQFIFYLYFIIFSKEKSDQ